MNTQVFKVTNIETEEKKALKAIFITDSLKIISRELMIGMGMELGKSCKYLVEYFETFSFEESYTCIIMDYFENGDLLSYLKKNQLNENVFDFW